MSQRISYIPYRHGPSARSANIHIPSPT